MRAKAEHNNLSKASKQKSLNFFIHVQHDIVLFECTQICICIYTYAFIYSCVCWCFYFLFFYRRTALERVWVGRTNNQASQVTHTHSVGTVWMCPAYRYSLFFGSRLRKATGWRSPNWKAQETNKLSFWWVNTGRSSECENVRIAACSCICCSLVKETDQMLFSQTYTLVSVRMQT